MNIKQALEYGIKLLKENKINEPILKVRIILSNILKQNKEYLMIHELEELDEDFIKLFKQDISKLCEHIPIQYVTKKQEFMGIEFYVDENVLIPQPDTEILVEEVVNICRGRSCDCPHKKIKILDLCTGSGAIGISLAKNIDNCEMTLSDISINALNIATKNCNNIVGVDAYIDPHKNIKIIQSDLFENIEGKFDIIVSNPPYIKSDVIKTLDKEVQNEPKLALDGGKDGLDIYRRIITQAYKFLNNNGYLCLEIGYDQKEEVIKLIEETNKYQDIYSKKDLAGNNRIIICKNCQKSIE